MYLAYNHWRLKWIKYTHKDYVHFEGKCFPFETIQYNLHWILLFLLDPHICKCTIQPRPPPRKRNARQLRLSPGQDEHESHSIPISQATEYQVLLNSRKLYLEVLFEKP